MEVKTTIVIYSKYSQACHDFLPLLDHMPIEARNLFSLRPLCIDNMKIRTMVLQAGISSVPCIQIIYKNDQFEKFEGKLAFDWVNDILLRYRGSSLVENKIDLDNDIQTTSQATPIKNLELENLKSKLESVEKSLEEARSKLELKGDIMTKNDNKQPPKKENKTLVTSLDDLPEISDDGEADELIDDTFSKERISADRSVKKTFSDKKSESLKNSAAEMQKQREELEESYSRGRRGLA